MSIYTLLKRIIDIALALIGLFLSGWLIALCVAYARNDTKASGFYKQVRVGLNGHPFEVLKIRTMRIVPGVVSSTTAKNDTRVTGFGLFLRKLKIDELPQLINVLKGEMSFVGPRPTVYEDFNRMSQRQRTRVKVKPGITGLAQISGNTSLKWPERIEFDLEYIKYRSIKNDIAILLRTFSLIATNRAHTDPLGNDEWN